MRRIALLLIPAFVACRGAESGTSRATLIDSRDTYDPRSLDPALSTDVPTGRAVGYVFDGLVRFSPDAQIVPALAKSWDVSNAGRTYTFHLRPGVKFHDGTPFVARHVLNSWKRVLDPKTKGGRGWPLYPIAGAKNFADGKGDITGITIVDDTTIVVNLDEPFAIFPKLLAMPVAAIVPDNPPANFGEHPIGTGPWKFVEWKHDDYLKFAKNPTYFGGAPKSDSLMARIVPEPSTAVAEFESGNVDVLYIPESETRNWEQTDDRKGMLMTAPALRLWYVAINTTRGPLKDVRVRQALNYATNSKSILDQLISGRGNVAAGVIPPTLDGADATRQPYAYNPAKAKQLLAAAGYPNGIDLEIWCSQTAPFPRVAQTIQANLAQAGIRVKIVQRDASSMREAARGGNTDLALKDWFADYPDAENFLYPLLHSSNKGPGGNVSFYSNANFDKLVTQARAELDDAKRAELYKQADAIAFNEAPMIYLFFYKELYAVQPWITGFQIPVVFTGQNWSGVQINKQ